MRSTSFIPFSLKPVELKTTWGNSYRSHSVHHEAKHCIEGTFLGGSTSFHIGFTPVGNRREFISYYRQDTNLIQIFLKIDSKTEYRIDQQNFQLKIGESFMSCIDTANNIFSTTNGQITLTSNFSSTNFHEVDEWYAFFDSGSGADINPNWVLFNLGQSAFNNTIPDGFSPWLVDISGLKGVDKRVITIHCKTNLQLTFLYISIIVC